MIAIYQRRYKPCVATYLNTRRMKGACILLEQMIGRDLFYLNCRYYLHEIILRGVFEEKLYKSSGSDVLLLKKFRESWPNINKLKILIQ